MSNSCLWELMSVVKVQSSFENFCFENFQLHFEISRTFVSKSRMKIKLAQQPTIVFGVESMVFGYLLFR